MGKRLKNIATTIMTVLIGMALFVSLLQRLLHPR